MIKPSVIDGALKSLVANVHKIFKDFPIFVVQLKQPGYSPYMTTIEKLYNYYILKSC